MCKVIYLCFVCAGNVLFTAPSISPRSATVSSAPVKSPTASPSTAKSPTSTPASFYCDEFSVTDTNTATQNYATCVVPDVCPGD